MHYALFGGTGMGILESFLTFRIFAYTFLGVWGRCLNVKWSKWPTSFALLIRLIYGLNITRVLGENIKLIKLNTFDGNDM